MIELWGGQHRCWRLEILIDGTVRRPSQVWEAYIYELRWLVHSYAREERPDANWKQVFVYIYLYTPGSTPDDPWGRVVEGMSDSLCCILLSVYFVSLALRCTHLLFHGMSPGLGARLTLKGSWSLELDLTRAVAG